MERPHIDYTQIGEADKRNLCSAFYDAITRFYENPANVRRFEAWRKAKSAAQND